MFFADYHVHSDISQDSAATMYEMVEAEAKMGMEQICFKPLRYVPLAHL